MSDNPYPLPKSYRQSDILTGDGRNPATYGPFDFKVFDVADVVVMRRAAGGNELFAEDEAATVTKTAGLAQDTFSVTFATAITSAVEFYVASRRLHERTASVTRGGAVQSTPLERELALLSQVAQELRRDVDRAVSVDPDQSLIRIRVPDDAGRFLVTDGTGNLVPGGSAEDIANAQANAEAAAAAADLAEAVLEAVNGVASAVFDPKFSTLAAAQGYSPTIAPDYIRIAGYSSAGDGGGALYGKVGAEPGHDGKFYITLADGLSVVWYELSETVVHERMFGASGASDEADTAAIQSLLDFGAAKNKAVFWVGRGYRIKSTLNVPDNVVLYALGGPVFFDAGSYHVEKSFNGDLFTIGRAVQIHDLTVNGKGASYTGRGIVVNSGGDQRLINCNILYFDDYCVEFVGASVGIRSQIKGGWYTRMSAGDVSIRWPDEAGNGNRLVESVYGDVLDVGSCDNGSVSGCNFSNIVFGSTAKKIKVTGTRISNAAIPATCVIYGVDHVFAGNIFSGDVSVESTFTYFDLSNRIAGSLGSPSPSPTNRVSLGPVSYTCVWTADVSNPVIGNGAVDAEYELDGAYCVVRIRMTAGTTTAFGSGVWSFSLPISPKKTTRARLGTAFAFDNGTAFILGQSVITEGSSTVKVLIGASAGNYAGANTPITWATGDRLEIEIRYRVN